MRTFVRSFSLAVLIAAALALAACDQTQGGGQGSGSTEADQPTTTEETGMEETTGTSGMSGMNHGGMRMGSEEMSRQMLTEDGEYSDERFIDHMVPHHQGAVEMAEVALDNAGHDEITELSRGIISSQEAEIQALKDIKEAEYGSRQTPMQMSPEDMEMMGMSMQPEQLAGERPFDRAFIDAMIPHHESAIEMSRIALEESENPEIREISRDIVDAQRAEIEQMQTWREEWYSQS